MHKNYIKPTFSFWENSTYFNNIDLIIVGSGIVGLSAAISYIEKNKKAKVVVLERGVLPHGASTKNAGFACFGSVSELMADLDTNTEDKVWATLEMRIKGLEILRNRLGDKQIDYKELGGYELFDKQNDFDKCANSIDYFNKKLNSLTGIKNTYTIENQKIKSFQFKQIKGLILNKKEGQLDTGKMMNNLLKLAISKGVFILNNVDVLRINDISTSVELETSLGDLYCKKVIVATNGFASQLLKLNDVKPARAQVLITKPILNLKIKGTFHLDAGYYYFRNIGNRVLLGGGRNLDYEKETTTKFELNRKIHDRLELMLKKIILPETKFEVEHRWCGIMGVGSEKSPIVKKISDNVVCAVRMGGMGVAIGSLVGKMASKELE
jgi:glycine/D-amino acid oxidase-like deaminating enzyme